MQPRKELKPTYLSDYKISDYLIETVDLTFELADEATIVTSQIHVTVNPAAKEVSQDLVLQGEDLQLLALKLNGEPLDPARYEVTDESLTIKDVPADFKLEIQTQINPEKNTQLSGLYKSHGNFITQCEAQGFRRMTYFLDRPDVMAKYTTTIIADQKKMPVLLSNGNWTTKGKELDGRHWVKYEDPFKKPSYLFALVAGNLECIKDKFITQSGREVTLKIYAEPGQAQYGWHAMRALKDAMRWDEVNYGRECDLDEYKIVAARDFNAGAMENKGLNIFNASRILASPEMTSDIRYLDILSVIAHEYFHNWTGDRVTVRDWFQLPVKEALTSFRDQSFSEDFFPLTRIDTVNYLKRVQFAEDASPLSHAPQPPSYIEVRNLYTSTIYRKGAEIFRMLQTLLGKDTFRQGMDEYFKRHDGEAVTIENFMDAMQAVTDKDLSGFMLWFKQAGTPQLDITDEYCPEDKLYTLRVKQSCDQRPDQPPKNPLPIPIRFRFLDQEGNVIPALKYSNTPDDSSCEEMQVNDMLLLEKSEQIFHFANVLSKPIPSLGQNFSAPVKINYNYTEEELLILFKHDTDLFNRLEALNQLKLREFTRLMSDYQAGLELKVSDNFISLYHDILEIDKEDPWVLNEILDIPTESFIANTLKKANIDAIHAARVCIIQTMAQQLADLLLFQYRKQGSATPTSEFDVDEAGKRALCNKALSYLTQLDPSLWIDIARTQFAESLETNMTNTLGVLRSITHRDVPEREGFLQAFYERWKDQPAVVDEWFGIQAESTLPNTLEKIKQLLQHEAFDWKNPNRVMALMLPFSRNAGCFHAISGEGYALVTEVALRLDATNAHLATRAVKLLTNWQCYDEVRQGLMRTQLQYIVDHATSNGVREVAEKSLIAAKKEEEKSETVSRATSPIGFAEEPSSFPEVHAVIDDMITTLETQPTPGDVPINTNSADQPADTSRRMDSPLTRLSLLAERLDTTIKRTQEVLDRQALDQQQSRRPGCGCTLL